MVQILRSIEAGRHPRRPRPPPRRLRPNSRQVPLPAGRRGRDAGRELRHQVPRRVPGALDGGCPMQGSSSLEGILAPVDQHTHSPAGRGARVVAVASDTRPRPSRHRFRASNRKRRLRVSGRGRQGDGRRPRGRGRQGLGPSRRPRRPDRDPGLLLRLRPGGRRLPHVPRRGRGDPEAPGRVHADRAGRDGRAHRPVLAKAAEGQENARSSSSSSTTRSTAPSATRAASARSRTTFRYGLRPTRMTFPKRTFEKPIPISPTIALDRERCILCYRCTRFSSDVAEDGQLVARTAARSRRSRPSRTRPTTRRSAAT